MEAPYPDDPYHQCNRWLFPLLSRYSFWQAHDFDDVIVRLAALPPPNTNERCKQLAASGLGATLPNLAYHIGTSSPPMDSSDLSDVAVQAKRLAHLWKICKPLAAPMNARGYAAFILAALKKRASPSLVVEISCTAKSRGLRPTDFIWVEQISTSLERCFAVEAKGAIRERDSEHLKRTLEGAEAIGIQL